MDRENTEKEGRGPLSLSRRRCCKFSARMAFFGERGKAACAYSILTWERRLPPTPIQRRRRFQGGEGERVKVIACPRCRPGLGSGGVTGEK